MASKREGVMAEHDEILKRLAALEVGLAAIEARLSVIEHRLGLKAAEGNKSWQGFNPVDRLSVSQEVIDRMVEAVPGGVRGP
jgi:hypothetical protein